VTSDGAARSGLGDKRRLIGFIAAIIVAGFGGSSVLAFLAARDAIRASIEGEALPAAAESVYAQLQTDLVEPVFISSMMANDTFLHGWTRQGETGLPAIRSYLGEIVRRYGAFTAFYVSEATKRYYTEEGILKTVSQAEPRDAWYWRVSRMAEPYELNVDPDLAHGDALTIFVNYRVVDASGAFLGVAGVGITVDSLRDIVVRFRSQFGTSIYFVDRSGTIVAGLPFGLAVAPRAIGSDSGLAAAGSRAMAAGGGSIRYTRGGAALLLRVLWLPELSWYVFVERPEEAAVSGSRRALWLNLGLCALVLALVVLASALTVDRFQSRLERSASHDPLTGTLNRLAFGAIADHSLKAARRARSPVSALVLDIDDFKAVNDSLGHPSGDAVIRAAAAGVRSAIRESDLLSRWGGEEFLVLLPGCGIEDALAAADKVRAAVAERSRADSPSRVTVSLGAAELGPGEDLDALVARADAALLEAKRGGKDRVASAPTAPGPGAGR
jgi:diguanylate cyclase (GGDEF)-like protein